MCPCSVVVMVLGLALLPAPAGDEHQDEAWPSDAQVIRYLEGKRIAIEPDPGRPNRPKEGKQSLLIPKGGIVAITVEKSGLRDNGVEFRFPSRPWETVVVFLVEQRGKRYAVQGVVKHVQVGADRAFYGFTARSIIEQ